MTGLGYALTLSTLCITLLKIFGGGLRPHFLTVCDPLIPDPPWGKGYDRIWYTPSQVCRADDKDLKEAQMSFPSGHSSAAFAGFGFLALYLNAKYKVMGNGHRFRDYYGKSAETPQPRVDRVRDWKGLLVVIPLLTAALFALSKVRDQWHHPRDIAFGALMGLLFAHLAYAKCYRSVYDARTNHIPLEGDGGEREVEG